MKKLNILIAFLLFFVTGAIAQNVPQGMKYQAIARSKAGEILANEKLELRVNLLSGNLKNPVIYYTETHSVITNELGLFTLVIGEGTPALKGTASPATNSGFSNIPWSTDEIWMEVGIKDKTQSDFVTISNSKLLAVPYAYFAASAAKVVPTPTILPNDPEPLDYETTCPCQGGIDQITFLYLGASGITINAFSDKDMHANQLIRTYNNVQNGDILTLNGPVPDGKLHNETYLQIVGANASVVMIPTTCEAQFVGENFGNFSVLTHTDDHQATCSVCDIRNNWKVGGNALFDMCNWLGTKSHTDIVLITNNIERMRISKDGDISINNNLHIGGDLNVDKNVNLNNVSGATINNGPLTVARLSPTLLSGTLTVDKATQLNSSLMVNGVTDLNSNLNVNFGSSSKLTGPLRVDGVTDLNNALNVNGGSPTVLSGTLRNDQDALFKQHVTLDNANYNTDTNNVNPTGALRVLGGTWIGRNLIVGGDTRFGGHTAFAGAVNISDATPSSSPSTGALIVSGGVGIGKQLYVAGITNLGNTLSVTGTTSLLSILGVTGAATLSSTLGVTGATTLSSTLGVTGATTLSSTLAVTGNTTLSGTLAVTGASTLTGLTTINNGLKVNPGTGQVVITGTNTGDAFNTSHYPLMVKGAKQGIVIQVSDNTPTGDNNFITFLDGNSTPNIRGRIEGQTTAELNSDPQYIFNEAAYVSQTVDAAALVVSAALDENVCAGLGAVVCPPSASNIVYAAINLVIQAAVLADFEANQNSNIGVTYQSGYGDYAEWLPKVTATEKFTFGDIVGVKGGLISKSTIGAEKMMVISQKPIVLGNIPKEGAEGNSEKVAFMGQVPVRILGKVQAGDYIIPGGNNDGVGIARHPQDMNASDYQNIVGIAWGTSDYNGLGMVKVAIGLNTNDVTRLVIKQDDKIAAQQNELDALKKQIDETNTQLAKLIPGFKAPAALSPNGTPATGVKTDNSPVVTTSPVVKQPGTLIQVPLTKYDLSQAFVLAEQQMNASGIQTDKSPFFKKVKSDPEYKEKVMNMLLEKFNRQASVRKNLSGK